MTELIKYEAVCRALAEAVAVDEVVDIRNKADAMRFYARQAKNLDLEISAAQIRTRAERRLGQMILEQIATVGLAKGGQPYRADSTCSDAVQVEKPPTLAEAGIDRKLSSRAQRTAKIGDIRFEALMGMIRAQAQRDGRVVVDVLKIDAENEQRDKRRDLARALSKASVDLPTGRKFPIIYADPPWKRKQGVTGRSYENHYDTMSWDDICAMPIADMVLPDAWLFLWIPRAHMFALHAVDTEVTTPDGEVVIVKVETPLAWAVAKSWGFEAYSTAFVWTKTDEAHPNDQGGGVLVFDQDEILLMFKRGRGLPKPATGEKFKSNHRERSREHSRKPDHYRDMIATMAGGVPVLELFARVDAEHPLPPDWEGWGNQAGAATADEIQSSDGGVESGHTGEQVLPSGILENPNPAAETTTELSPAAGEPMVGAGVAPSPSDDLLEHATADEPPASVAEGEDGDEALSSPSSLEPIDEFTALKALSDFCYPNRIAIAAVVAADYIARGFAFQYSGRKDWSLTEAGWARLRELDAERKAASAATPDEENTTNAVVSRETASDDATYRVEYDAMVALESGDHVAEELLDALRAKQWIAGKATKAKLTKAGQVALKRHREHFEWLAKLALLPTSIRQLTGRYGIHLFKLHERVMASDKAGAAEEREMLELLCERANGDTSFGSAVNDEPEHLRNENRAPIGQEPMWYQRGVFRLDIDGTPYLVTHDESANFAVYAEDPDKPFQSETGFHSFLGYGFEFGRTVAQHAEAVIRDGIANVDENGGGRRKPRKKSLQLPACVYRLPTPEEGGCEPIHVSGSIWPSNEQPAGVAVVGAPETAAAQALPDLFSAAGHGAVQTRMPLDDEEIELRDVLTAFARGESPPLMHVFTLREIERDLIGRGWLESPETGALSVTAEGHAWLASMGVAVANPAFAAASAQIDLEDLLKEGA